MANVDWDPGAYLDSMLAEIPRYAELQDRVASATDGAPVGNVLELGTGTGETARRILALHPEARWTGVDASEAMLAAARETLPEAELRRRRLEDALPPGPFDLVVSVLAIHHLDGGGKADLFRRIAGVLTPGGLFVLGDVVVPPREEDVQIEIDWVVDLPDRLDDQLLWLAEAGLEPETLWEWKDLAVVRSTRPPRPG